MSRQMKWSEKKVAELEAQGIGTGKGELYKPWIEVTDFSSKGRSRRIHGLKTGRVHHFFSDVEYQIFLAAEWSRTVVDIREQYPLDRGLSQTIAHKLGIAHPCYPRTQVPTVMTVDFLLTVIENGTKRMVAINAKRDEEAEDVRSLEKLEIQRTYFEQIETQHHLIYHSQLPHLKIKNIAWIREAQPKEGEIELHHGYWDSYCSRMADDLRAPRFTSYSLAEYCNSFDIQHGLETGTGLRVARMLIQNRALMVNLDIEKIDKEPISSFLMTSLSGQLRAVGGA